MSSVKRRPRGGTVRYTNLAAAEASPIQARATKVVHYVDLNTFTVPARSKVRPTPPGRVIATCSPDEADTVVSSNSNDSTHSNCLENTAGPSLPVEVPPSARSESPTLIQPTPPSAVSNTVISPRYNGFAGAQHLAPTPPTTRGSTPLLIDTRSPRQPMPDERPTSARLSFRRRSDLDTLHPQPQMVYLPHLQQGVRHPVPVRRASKSGGSPQSTSSICSPLATPTSAATFVSAGGMVQGWRKTMEDRLVLGVVREEYDYGRRVGAFAVILDGHRGSEAAELASHELPKLLLRRLGEAPFVPLPLETGEGSAHATELASTDALWQQRYHIFVDAFAEMDVKIFEAQGGTDTFPIEPVSVVERTLSPLLSQKYSPLLADNEGRAFSPRPPSPPAPAAEDAKGPIAVFEPDILSPELSFSRTPAPPLQHQAIAQQRRDRRPSTCSTVTNTPRANERSSVVLPPFTSAPGLLRSASVDLPTPFPVSQQWQPISNAVSANTNTHEDSPGWTPAREELTRGCSYDLLGDGASSSANRYTGALPVLFRQRALSVSLPMALVPAVEASKAKPVDLPSSAGTTVVAVYADRHTITVANLGDCRAFLLECRPTRKTSLERRRDREENPEEVKQHQQSETRRRRTVGFSEATPGGESGSSAHTNTGDDGVERDEGAEPSTGSSLTRRCGHGLLSMLGPTPPRVDKHFLPRELSARQLTEDHRSVTSAGEIARLFAVFGDAASQTSAQTEREEEERRARAAEAEEMLLRSGSYLAPFDITDLLSASTASDTDTRSAAEREKPFPRVRGKLAVTRALGDFDLKFDLLRLACEALEVGLPRPPGCAPQRLSAPDLLRQRLSTHSLEWYDRTHRTALSGDGEQSGSGSAAAADPLNGSGNATPGSSGRRRGASNRAAAALTVPELFFSPFLISNVPQVKTLRRGRLPPPVPVEAEEPAAGGASPVPPAVSLYAYDAIIAGCDGVWELQTVEAIGRRLDSVLQPLLAERARLLQTCWNGSGTDLDTETVGYSGTTMSEDMEPSLLMSKVSAAVAAAGLTTSGTLESPTSNAINNPAGSINASGTTTNLSTSAEDALREWESRAEAAVRTQVIEASLLEAVAPTCRGGTGATPGADNMSLTISLLLE